MFQRSHLRLKEMLISAFAFLACVAVFIVLVVYAGRARTDVALDLEYYFLVRNCSDSTSAAVVGEVYSSGGAGYLDGDSVILACYYTRADARRVCSLMEQKGEAVYVSVRSLKSITLRGKDAAYGDEVKQNVDTAASVAHLLYDTANGLETGKLSQSSAKTNLKGAADALNGLISCNDDSFFDAWNRKLYSAAAAIGAKKGEILFSKDVRYLQVSLCCALLELGSCF